MITFPFSQNLFWDCHLEDIDLEKNKNYIIGRVLTRGQRKDFDTLITLYSSEEIVAGITKSKELDSKTAHFCCWYFKIPSTQLHVSSFYH